MSCFFLRSSDAKEPVPADIRAELYIPYNLRTDSIETIYSAISSAFVKDERIINDDISRLVSQDRKRFLSRTVLENLNDATLKDDQIATLMSMSKTIENLCDKSIEEIAKRTGIKKGIITTVQDELRGYLEDK